MLGLGQNDCADRKRNIENGTEGRWEGINDA